MSQLEPFLSPNAPTLLTGGIAATVPANAKLAPGAKRDEAGGKPTPPLQIVLGSQRQPPLYAYIRNMSPDDLSGRLEAFDRGQLRTVVPAWRKMARRDGHLLSVSEKRLGRIRRLDWEVNPVDSSAEAARQAEYLSAFYETIPLFETRISELSEALNYSIAGHEIEWLPGAGPDRTLGCKLWHQTSEHFDLQQMEPRLYIGATPTLLQPSKFLVHRRAVALMEGSSILFIMKLISAGQWLSFGEKFGMPGLIGNAPPGANTSDIDKFYEMLCNWGSELAAVCPSGYTVTTLQPGAGTGELTYHTLIRWADGENSKIWTGHTLTADAKSGTGTLAGEGAADQLDELVDGDARGLEDTIDTHLGTPAVLFQFAQPLLAKIHFKTEKALDKSREADTDSKLINDLGLELPLADLYKKYNWRQPEPGEIVAKGRRSAPAVPLDASDATPTPFKTSDIKAVVETITSEALGPVRDATDAMFKPLRDLVNNAGDMTPEEFRTKVLALSMPAADMADELETVLRKATDTGASRVLMQARAAMGAGGGGQ